MNWTFGFASSLRAIPFQWDKSSMLFTRLTKYRYCQFICTTWMVTIFRTIQIVSIFQKIYAEKNRNFVEVVGFGYYILLMLLASVFQYYFVLNEKNNMDFINQFLYLVKSKLILRIIVRVTLFFK